MAKLFGRSERIALRSTAEEAAGLTVVKSDPGRDRNLDNDKEVIED
jgi:hypothetical protein